MTRLSLGAPAGPREIYIIHGESTGGAVGVFRMQRRGVALASTQHGQETGLFPAHLDGREFDNIKSAVAAMNGSET